ncbi:uncharacterized protein B0H18DRAFT_1037978 [Fomitopsis serialis]|uniref:uncharacterized protein n=1 Tax=Fomitopsis serialis TaxID=139415 RepID=UPI002007DD54|nr:uncharacterized protein B0H18DRAFT_1037978 [Neoantrodia serialis]KAH9916662.1 hypothetical protein B0H18DRAFT_1037978 [Neoantrodia serialis]
MANITRSSKAGSDWTPNELLAYNIRVVYQDYETFFKLSERFPPDVRHKEVLTLQDPSEAAHDDTYVLLRTMALAMNPRHGQESAVADYAVVLFKCLQYIGDLTALVPRTRMSIPFWVCGQEKLATADVCLVDDTNDPGVLVQEDKQHMDRPNSEPQLIASAIAALSNINETRLRTLGRDTIASKLIPGITMKGTMPVFYKIPVTSDLVRAVQLGEYPAQETVVYAHLPPVPRPARRYSEGMAPLDNRKIVISCYGAFRRFLFGLT